MAPTRRLALAGTPVLVLVLVLVLATAASASAARPTVSWRPAAGYTEGAPAQLLASRADVADRDSRTLTGARIRILGEAEHGERLSFVDQLGTRRIGWTPIDAGTAPTVSALRLTGRASIADYERALRSVWYQHAGDDPSRSRRIAIQVRDGSGKWSRRSVRGFYVTFESDASNLGVVHRRVEYEPGGGPQPIAPNLALLDLDSRIAGATVAISSNHSPSEDQLVFDDQRGIQGTYDSGTGVLTLAGSAPVTDYQAAMRSVRYSTSAPDPGGPGRTFTFQVTDTSGAQSAALTMVLDDDYAEPSLARAFTEGSPPVALADGYAGILIGETSPYAVASRAQVRLRGARAGERLFFVDQLGISGTYDSGTGVLTLTGRADRAKYQAALASVWYQDTGDRPRRSRAIEVRWADRGGRWSHFEEGQFAVAPANDAPYLAPASGQFDYRLGGGPKRIGPGIALLDPDSRLSRAAVQISSNFSEAEDQLVFENQRGITGTYDSGTGVLTLSGAASGAAYQAALRSVEYVNNSSKPANPSRAITFTVTDVFGADSAPSIWDDPFFF